MSAGDSFLPFRQQGPAHDPGVGGSQSEGPAVHHGHPGAVRWVKNIRHSQTYPSPRNTLRTVLAEHSKSATLIPRRLQPLHPVVAATRQLQVPLRIFHGPVIVPLPPAATPAARCWVSTRSRWRSSGGWPLLPAFAASPPVARGRPSREAPEPSLAAGPALAHPVSGA